MPQIGTFLRGHQLARDGAPRQLVSSVTLVHRVGGFADIEILRPADADRTPSVGDATDGFLLPLQSTLQVAAANIQSIDPASGSLTLKLQRNGVSIPGWQATFFGPIIGNSQQLFGGPQTTFLAQDVWALTAEQSLPGAGIGSHFNVTVFFYT